MSAYQVWTMKIRDEKHVLEEAQVEKNESPREYTSIIYTRGNGLDLLIIH